MLILSLFPGIDLLGRGFEAEGFCIVRGPDLIYGGDIRNFNPPPGKFEGIIAGSPCQDFSGLNRNPGDYSYQMLQEFIRCVHAAMPEWWLLENVTRVPDVTITGYITQRLDLSAHECGMNQSRRRHFQFGSRYGYVIVPDRKSYVPPGELEPICTASEGKRTKRTWKQFCSLMGLPDTFDLPGMSKTAKYQAVGNGVPIPMGQTIARAIKNIDPALSRQNICACGCGRMIRGRQVTALPACRKRMERRRKRGDKAPTVTLRYVTDSGMSQTGCDVAAVSQPGAVTPVTSQSVNYRSQHGASQSQDVTRLSSDTPGVSHPGEITLTVSQMELFK